MNIKQAEDRTGVSRQNIRFYEKQGLLAPGRNPDNDYREYTEADLQNLKWIRAMRMLDMPLDDIRQVLDGHMPLAQAAQAQQERLENQKEKLENAIHFCGTLKGGSLAALDVDACLAEMEAGGGSGYFRQWKQDFLAVSAAEHQRVFTFTPETPVTNPQEFTDALFAYAEDAGVELVLTKESMYPEFTIDGIEYTAWRDYHSMGGYGFACPVATIHCEMAHPEAYFPPVSSARRRFLRILNASWPWLLFLSVLLVIFLPGFLRSGGSIWEVLVLFGAFAGVFGVRCYLYWRYYFNDKTK